MHARPRDASGASWFHYRTPAGGDVGGAMIQAWIQGRFSGEAFDVWPAGAAGVARYAPWSLAHGSVKEQAR
jgi:hypothetical protein